VARPEGLEPSTLGLAYQLLLLQPYPANRQVSLWSGLSLHHLRCCTYSLYGALRKLPAFGDAYTHLGRLLLIRRPWRLRDTPVAPRRTIGPRFPQVSTGLPSADLLRVPRYGAVHFASSVS